jgi:microcystin-dependent protein
MSFRTIFNNLAGGSVQFSGPTQPASLLDQQFTDIANWCVLPCTASGTNNLVLTPQQYVATLPAYGFFNLFSFISTGASTAPVFAQVGNLSQLPVYFNDGTQVSSGGLLANNPYFLMYSPNLNNGSGGFYLLPIAITAGQAFPPGVIVSYGVASPIPVGWLYCNGQAVSRVIYAGLYNVIGTTWGVGDGTTTFNVPDYRGWFERGWDDGAMIDTGRVFASKQQDQLQDHDHTYIGYFGNVAASGTAITAAIASRITQGIADTPAAKHGAETRAKNLAIIKIIKT